MTLTDAQNTALITFYIYNKVFTPDTITHFYSQFNLKHNGF